MISFKDSVVLGWSKLRSRPLRTIVALFVSSILFGVSISVLITSSAITHGFQEFDEAVFGGRHIVQVEYFENNSDLIDNNAVKNEAKRLYTLDVDKKEKAARKTNTKFDIVSVINPIEYRPGDDQPILNLSSPYAQSAIADYRQSHPDENLALLKTTAQHFHSTDIQQINGLTLKGTVVGLKGHNDSYQADYKGLDLKEVRVIDSSLLSSFMLRDSSRSTSSDTVDILLPVSLAGKIVDMNSLDINASPEQKVSWLKELSDKVVGSKFNICYSDEAGPLDSDNVDKKDQDLSACSMNEPITGYNTLRVRVVGLLPDDSLSASQSGFWGAVSSVLGTTQLGHVTMATNSYDLLDQSLKSKFQLSSHASPTSPNQTFLIEFPSIDDAKNFMNQISCSLNTCANQTFAVSEFGSNSIKLTELEVSVSKIILGAVIAITLLATIIMGGVFSRVMSDNRRETAVFRAIGAQTNDIIKIYVTYAGMLSILTASCAVFCGALLSYILDCIFWKNMTLQAILLYGVNNSNTQVHLFTFDEFRIWWIVLAVILTGVLSMVAVLPAYLKNDVVRNLKNE